MTYRNEETIRLVSVRRARDSEQARSTSTRRRSTTEPPMIQTARLLIEHARRQGFFVVDGEPAADVLRTHPRVARITFGTGANAFGTSMDLPVAQAVIRAIEAVRGPVIKLPTMGGSLPIGFIEGALGTHLINIHMSNPDSNNHSSNENLRLQNLWDGIEQVDGLLLLDVRP